MTCGGVIVVFVFVVVLAGFELVRRSFVLAIELEPSGPGTSSTAGDCLPVSAGLRSS